jgi:hypothetical protein
MHTKAILLLSAVGLVAACGGSSDGSAVNPTTPPPTVTRTFAVDTSTPSLALMEGKTLTAQSSQIASITTNYTDRTTSAKTETFKLMLNQNQELSMEVDGKLYDFKPADRSLESDEITSYGYAVQGEVDESGNIQYYSLFSYDDVLEQIISADNEELVQIWKYLRVTDNRATESANGSLGFLVVGSETKPEALGNFTTKVYNGRVRSEVYAANNFSSLTNRGELRSDNLELTANFQTNTISGNASNLTYRERESGLDAGDYQQFPGSFTFENGAITGSDFIGDLKIDQIFKESAEIETFTGTFSGTFFGQGAEQVGGVIQGLAVGVDGENSNIVGAFKAD